MSEELQKGDSVSWNWGSGQPSGTVEAVVPEEHSIESKNGKEIKSQLFALKQDGADLYDRERNRRQSSCRDQAGFRQSCIEEVC